MLRLLYTLLIYVAAPIAFAVTLWRGVRDPLYRDRRAERFGWSSLRLQQSLWVHAVSVGEVQAAAALIRELQRRHPDVPLIVTTATPTGAARVRALFGETVHHSYLPYDLPCAVRRFLDRIQPRLAIVMETEIWPNLYRECAHRAIPIVLASARLSEKSVRRFRRIAGLFRDTLNQDIVIGAQTAMDAERFVQVGANPGRVHVTGNIKFDIEIPADVPAQGAALREAQFPGRFVWVAGSTHEGEEQIVLDAHRELLRRQPDALLILVPRHPNRFARVRQWLVDQSAIFATRSREEAVNRTTQVLLADTLGELLMLYAAGDVAFVGGSFVTVGGHNLLEPAALARPILTGPHNFNAPDIAQLLFAAGAAVQVDSASSLAQVLYELQADPARRERIGSAARSIVESNRGSLGRLLTHIELQLRKSTTHLP